MTEYVTHEAVETLDGTVTRIGGTRRLQVVAPGATMPDDDVVRLDVDGTTYRAPITGSPDGDLLFRGAYESPGQAREGTGTNHLAAYLEATNLAAGRTIYVDIVDEGFRYGVRAPGESATYRDLDAPSSSLADIARNLDG